MDVTALGNVFALLGAALAVLLTGVGASIGMSWVQQAAAGVVTEQPHKFGKTLIFQLIPSSAALYGFVVGFLIFMTAVMDDVGYTYVEGLTLLAVCLPIGVVGLVSTLGQAKVAAAGIRMLGRDERLMGKGIIMAVFIELFALFALIIAVLTIFSIGGDAAVVY